MRGSSGESQRCDQAKEKSRPVLIRCFVFYIILFVLWRRYCHCFNLRLSQDHDAVCSQTHQNSRQVLVPQELPVPDVQGRMSAPQVLHRGDFIDSYSFSLSATHVIFKVSENEGDTFLYLLFLHKSS